jgi:hypothetical protein
MLNFALLDDLALARERRGAAVLGHLAQINVQRLGPLVELCMLDRMRPTEPAALDALRTAPALTLVRQAVPDQRDPAGRYGGDLLSRFGAIGTNRNPLAEDTVEWVQFCRKAQEAAEFAALPKVIAHGLIGAMRELEDNIHLHSRRAQDGIVAFRGTVDEFEFVVADSGIGVLQGLREAPRYTHLTDAGAALKTALSDGQSRLLDQDPGRGFGFHDLFVSLANLYGELRFRSDDHALTIDGSGPALPQARLAQKATLQGFVISIVCTPKPQPQESLH